MIRIEYTGAYEKVFRRLLEKNPSLHDDIDISVKRFCRNPKDTRIHTHALRKRMRGKYAFSVTGDIRIIFVWLGKSTARFLVIGSHTDVYPRL